MVKWHAGVVVGVDGSWEASHALEWAATVAERHDARLTVLSAYTTPPSVAGPGYNPGQGRSEADRAVERALELLEGRTFEVVGKVVQGGAAYLLVQRSRTSDLVVVGRRGLSGTDRILLGSVSSAVAAMSHGPVAVVPAGAPDGVPRRVVAAVDTDDYPGPVLDVAFDEAASTERPLNVVHAIDPGVLAGALPLYGSMAESWREWALRAIEADTDGWAEKYPQVEHDVQLLEGPPSDVLLGHLQPDDLVVVGGRRHFPVLGRVLGSVPDRLLRHAPCPVMIIHAQSGVPRAR